MFMKIWTEIALRSHSELDINLSLLAPFILRAKSRKKDLSTVSWSGRLPKVEKNGKVIQWRSNFVKEVHCWYNCCWKKMKACFYWKVLRNFFKLSSWRPENWQFYLWFLFPLHWELSSEDINSPTLWVVLETF